MLQKIIKLALLEKTEGRKKTETLLEKEKIAGRSGFLASLIGFIKYHNAVSIGISLVLVLSFSAMASEDARDAVLGEKIVVRGGVDNSLLLAEDLEKFDLEMEVIGVEEDEENYYVKYSFNTIGILDNVWSFIHRDDQMAVSKAALAGRDLGLYAEEELGEIIDNELAYLKEAKKNEQEKGQTFAQETTKYTGLIGLIIDTKTKKLPGYEPVAKPPKVEKEKDVTPTTTAEPTLSPELSPTPEVLPSITPIPDVTPTPDPSLTPTPTPTETPTSTPTPTPQQVCFCHGIDSNPQTICTSNEGQINGHDSHVNNGTDTLGECLMPTPTPTPVPTLTPTVEPTSTVTPTPTLTSEPTPTLAP